MKYTFSIIIDECTDILITQILAVVVRYFDTDKDVVDALLDTVAVGNGNAHNLYNAVKDLLLKRGVPLNNIVRFGSDNCSTMMGRNTGFQKFLKDDVPSVIIMVCVSHSFAQSVFYLPFLIVF